MTNADDDVEVGLMIASLEPGRHDHVLRHVDQHQAGDSGDTFEFVLDVLLARFGSATSG